MASNDSSLTVPKLSGKSHNLQLHDKDKDKLREVDIFRDTPVRYLGYANEVGEAFRSLIHVNLVRLSYGVASAYACADACSKGNQASVIEWPNDSVRRTKVVHAVVDTLVWQGLASVAVPGFTINRICWMSNLLLKQLASSLAPASRHWAVTAIGLGAIPLIIKPIDRSVDSLMEATLRKWYNIEPIEKHLIYHKRAD